MVPRWLCRISGRGGERHRGGRLHHVHGPGEQQQDTRQKYCQQHRHDRLAQVRQKDYLHAEFTEGFKK